MIPNDLRYTSDHEWVRASESDPAVVRVGITDYAQNSLGDIVFVDMPDAGVRAEAGSTIGEVESTKSVSEVIAPLSGTVVTRNESLEDQPELVNTDPYGDGWLFELEASDAAAIDALLDADGYASEIGEN